MLCSVARAQIVGTSHALGVDFSKYHTYRWVAIKSRHFDPILDTQIKQSFDSALAARGLTKADEIADLDIDYQAAATKTETWQVYEDWTKTDLMEQRLPQRKKVIIAVGTLVIDMYDTTAKERVWTGSAKKTIDPNSSREDRQRNLDKVAKKLLAEFPPK